MLPKAVLLAILPAYVAAVANDWNVPCTSGTCAYTSGDGVNTAWSTLEIHAASTSSLSDITRAAGWDILDCDSNSAEPQEIRLVCVDPSKGCDQLHQGGDTDTIIRLPENCGAGPFARVTRNTWVHQDQSLPARLAKKRDVLPPVSGLAFDFGFTKSQSKNKVWMTVSATNDAAQRDALRSEAAKRSLNLRHVTRRGQASAIVKNFAAASHHGSQRQNKRQFGFLDDISDFASDVGNTIVDGASAAGNAIVDGATAAGNAVVDGANAAGEFISDTASDAGEAISDAAGSVVDFGEELIGEAGDALDAVGDAISDGVTEAGETVGGIVDAATGEIVGLVEAVGEATEFNTGFDKELELININENALTLIDVGIDCANEATTQTFAAGIKVNADVAAQLNSKVGFIAVGSIIPPQLDDFAVTGSLSGSIETTFRVNANAKGTVGTGEIEVVPAIGLPGLSFPGILTVGPSVSVVAEAKAELGVTANVEMSAKYEMPTLEFVFPPDNGASNGDATPSQNAPLTLSVGASAELTGTAEAHIIPRLNMGIDVLNGIGKANVFLNLDGFAVLEMGLSASASATPISSDFSGVDFSNEIETSFGGRVGMDLGIAMNAGIEGELFGLISAGTELNIFEKRLNIFEKTFGDQAQDAVAKRSLYLPSSLMIKRQGGLTCPAPAETEPSNAVPLDGGVAAGDATA